MNVPVFESVTVDKLKLLANPNGVEDARTVCPFVSKSLTVIGLIVLLVTANSSVSVRLYLRTFAFIPQFRFVSLIDFLRILAPHSSLPSRRNRPLAHGLRRARQSYPATGVDFNSVQSAVELANDGDIVQLPAGNEVWQSTLVITKGITIRGMDHGLWGRVQSGPLFNWSQTLQLMPTKVR